MKIKFKDPAEIRETFRRSKIVTTAVMEQKKQKRKMNRAKQIALCGVLGALALVLMFIAGLTGVGTYAGPLFAAIVLIPISEEWGTKTGLTAWAAISILALIMMPDRELALIFLCFGWYPLALRSLYRIKSKVLCFVIKLAAYLLMVLLVYGVLMTLLGIDAELTDNTRFMNILLLILGAAVFLTVDVLYTRVIVLWNLRWRSGLNRML